MIKRCLIAESGEGATGVKVGQTMWADRWPALRTSGVGAEIVLKRREIIMLLGGVRLVRCDWGGSAEGRRAKESTRKAPCSGLAEWEQQVYCDGKNESSASSIEALHLRLLPAGEHVPFARKV